MILTLTMVALAAATLAFLVAPLLRRQAPPAARADYDVAILRDRLKEIDREVERGVIGAAEAETSRTEIQRRLLAAARTGDHDTAGPAQTPWRTVAVVAVLVPVGGFALYLTLGSPDIPDHLRRTAPRSDPATAAHAGDGAAMDQMVERLNQRLRANPNDADGWQLLARSYVSMQRYQDAANAYRHAMLASNNRADIAADYAEVLFVTAGSTVTPEARQMFEAVQAADPLNPKARYYLGLGMAERGDLKGALQAWTDLAHLSPPDAPWMQFVHENIGRAAAELGVEPRTVQPSPDAVRLAGAPRPAPAMPPAMPPPTAQAPAPATIPPPGGAVAPPLNPEAAAAIQAMPEADRTAMIRSMVERLAQRLKENPNDREGWLRLARAYDVLGEKEKANEARARAGEAK